MEMNDKDNLEMDRTGFSHNLNYHSASFFPEANPSMAISQGGGGGHNVSSPSPSLVPMAASFPNALWNPSTQNLVLSETADCNSISGHPMLDMGSVHPFMLPKNGPFLASMPGIFPPSLSNFPADSGFVERAARYSCFNGGMMMSNAFASPETLSHFPNASRKNEMNVPEVCKDAPFVNQSGTSSREHREMESSHGVGAANNESGEPESSGCGQDEGPDVSGNKKRKRPNQNNELKKVERNQELLSEATKENNANEERGESKRPVATSGKSTGKQSKDSTDASKEDFIHVRARCGQATNSHSLAERVRREKISERMKFLQDLVPGCSKVTGKAVMLDEIINYVQSLQRQVEFLSMKLATVNPRLDLNIEGILSKDLFHSQGGPSCAIGFIPPSQLVQAGLSGSINPADVLRRINTQVPINSGFKDPTPQMPNAWDGEFQDVMQMSYTPASTRELSTQSRDGFPNRRD